MKAMSIEIRQLIIVAKQRGETHKDIAKWFGVKTVTVKMFLRYYKRTGSIVPKSNVGRISVLTEEQITKIHNKIEAESDAALAEIIDDLNLPIKKSQLAKWLKKNGYSYKKKRYIHQLKTDLM
jgi:transposase